MKSEPTDEEIITQQRRGTRKGIVLGGAAGLILVGLTALTYKGIQSGFLEHFGMGWIADKLLTYFPLALLIGVCIFYFRQRGSAKPLPEGFLRRHVDHYQSLQRWGMLLYVGVLGILCVNQARIPWSSPSSWITITLFALVATLSGCFVAIGTGFLNPRFHRALADELNKALRAKATRLGYLLALILLVLDDAIALMKPYWITAAIPASIFAVVAIPALYLAWLEWRASRGG